MSGSVVSVHSAHRVCRQAVVASLLIAITLVAVQASAQTGVRPSERLSREPETPPRQGAETEQAPELAKPVPDSPHLPEQSDFPKGPLARGLRMQVETYRVEGSTVLSDAEVEAATADFAGRPISSEDLAAARDRVTALYVERGYVTSGVVIPDQDMADGIVVLRAVEGTLADVEVRGTKWFEPRFFSSRLMRAAGTPVDLRALERKLQVLQRHSRIRRISAQLQPGERFGESRLVIDVDEAPPMDATFYAANDISPALGAYAGGVNTSFVNAIGWADAWTFNYHGGAGLQDFRGAMSIPVTPWDTLFILGYRYAKSEIVQADFTAINVIGESQTFTAALHQPVYRRDGHELWLGLAFERRSSQSSIDDIVFCFEVPEEEDCKAVVTAFRPYGSYTWRGSNDVVAMRGLISIGVEALDSTVNDNPHLPQGQFLAFLGQMSWAHLFDTRWIDPTLVTRFDMQFASSPLLSIERISIGGARTVRGYRENELVRDQGIVASAELRIPLLPASSQRQIELVPFVDYGRGWNAREPRLPRDLTSMGLGLRALPLRWLSAEFFWGYAFDHVPYPTDDALQGNGINFRVQVFTP
jgi:hemolysin activation/secretion protein